jgi:hypothetical protein
VFILLLFAGELGTAALLLALLEAGVEPEAMVLLVVNIVIAIGSFRVF